MEAMVHGQNGANAPKVVKVEHTLDQGNVIIRRPRMVGNHALKWVMGILSIVSHVMIILAFKMAGTQIGVSGVNVMSRAEEGEWNAEDNVIIPFLLGEGYLARNKN